jgi:tetratricopeptide (TPR) repeat protein
MGRKQKLKEQKKMETAVTAGEARLLRDHRQAGDRRDFRRQGTMYYIIYAGLVILLLYPPYFRGMFFDREFLPTHIYTGVLFLSWILYKSFILKENKLFRSPIDYAALALAGAYFISIFAAVNIRFAVGELLKYINYFMAFYLVSDIARTREDAGLILWAMVLSAFGVAFTGIGAAAGTLTYNGAFVGGRINSTIQYPNTLAAYLTAAFMISASLRATAGRRWQRGIASLINYTLFLCFLFTLSRAAWLMFPVFFLILIIGMPGEYRMKALGYSLETFTAAIVASPGFGSAVSAAQEGRAWMWYASGAALALILFYTAEKMSERFAVHIRPKAVIAALIVFAVLAGAGGYIAFTTEAPLTLSHAKDEPESWKTAWYPVEDVKPDTEYTLKVNISSTPGEKQEQWGAAVFINSVDENKNQTRILNEYVKEGLNGEVKEITFTTRPDTKSLYIGFSNFYPGTAAAFSNAELYEAGNPSSSRRLILAYKYIPQAVSRRISSISAGDRSVVERMVFYKDALKIIKDHPVLGTGGGGWKSVYFAYQSYRYFSTEVHSFFLQLWVETGTVGLLALIALWLAVFAAAYRAMRSDLDSGIRALTWGALSGAVALVGHSTVDFNLSLGAVALYLWSLFGIINSISLNSFAHSPAQSEESSSGKKRRLKDSAPVFNLWPAAAVSCIFIIGSFFLYQGYTYGQQAVAYIQQQDILKARDAFAKAAKYDPLTASFRADLAQLEEIMGRQMNNASFIEKAEQDRQTAVNLDPYNPKLRAQLAASYLQKGKLPEGLAALEKVTELNPYNINAWEDLADAYEKVAEVYIRQGKKDEALGIIKKSQGIFDKISALNLKSPQNAPEKLEVTNKLMLYVYKARLLAENIDDKNYYRKLRNLVFASDLGIDADHNGIPDVWRISNSEKGLLNIDMAGGFSKMTNDGEGPSYLFTKEDISLEPQNLYTINLIAGGSIPKEKIMLNIFSREGKSPQYQLKEINLSREPSTITGTFLTTKDITAGKQWLRLDIQGSPGNYINIKGIEIWME